MPTLSINKAMRAQMCIDAYLCGKLKIGPEYHSAKAKKGALLVEPVNGNPFVIVGAYDKSGAPIWERYSCTEFETIPGSGTDCLRQRIKAQLFFDAL